MPLDAGRLKAVLFDYGNTLIPFGRKEIDACNVALRAVLVKHYGRVDDARLMALREAARSRPLNNGYRENELTETCSSLVRALYDMEPGPAVLEEMLRARHDSVVEAIQAPSDVAPLLQRLSSRYRLGLVSNYTDDHAIRASLERTGLAGFFDAVVVSGGVGYVKPHSRPFEVCLNRLGLSPHDVVHVGDNWLADIQGAKRLGMQAVFVTQYQHVDDIPRQADDHQPDATIKRVTDVEDLLKAA